MLTCPLLALSAVYRGQHGHPDWSVAMHSHKQQTAMHCVFWHFSMRTSIHYFSNMSKSSSYYGSDSTGQPSLPTCINEPWLPMTLFGPLLLDNDHYRPGRPTRTAALEMLWPSHLAITIWPLSNSLKSLCFPILHPASNTSTLRTTCCLIYPTH